MATRRLPLHERVWFRNRLCLCAAMIAVAMVVWTARNARAVQTTWVGAEGANWSVDSNWNNHEPTSSVDAYLNNGNTAVINQSGEACRYLYLGKDASTTGNLNAQSGSLAAASYLYVGDIGSGTLAISGGGQVSSAYAYVASSTGSTGAVTVDGANSKWTSANAVSVGIGGSGTLTITAGGQVLSRGGSTGVFSGSTGIVTLDGPNSTWLNSSGLAVGKSGFGTMTITGGGQVSNTDGSVGYNVDGRGMASVDGANSKWANSSTLYIGRYGPGTLAITGGGQVSSVGMYVGYATGSTGTVTVDGLGSTWNNSNAFVLSVGLNGSGTLSIKNGGQVSSPGSLAYLGQSWGSTGTVTVDGPNSMWTAAGVVVGSVGGHGTLTITGGGQVSSGRGDIAQAYGTASTGTATVDGPNSMWTISTSLSVGYQGPGTMTVRNGGQVSDNLGLLTFALRMNPKDDAKPPFSGLPLVGLGSLAVQDPIIGWSSNDTSVCSVTVDGANSRWTNSSYLSVGHYGWGTLTISSGGQVISNNGYVGSYLGSSGTSGTATVTGNASNWSTNNLYVGGSETSAGGTGILSVTDGSQVTVASILQLWNTGSLSINRGTVSAGTLEGPAGMIRISDAPGSMALTVGSAAGGTFSGSIVDDTTPGSLAKIGGGTQTLGGNNTYSGLTTITGGALLVNGTHTGGGLYTVGSGATLGGTGSIGANVLVNLGGLLAPGASVGTLAITGNADIEGLLQEEILNANADRITGLQLLTLGPASVLNIAASGNAFTGSTYVLADYQTLSGTFGTINNLPGTYRIDYGSGSHGSITLVPIPEPSTLALLATGVGALLAYACRRRVPLAARRSGGTP